MHTISTGRRKLPPFSRVLGGWTVFAGPPGELCRNLLDMMLAWQERAAQRRALAEMDAHLLKDLGISRSAALEEVRKPFWRA